MTEILVDLLEIYVYSFLTGVGFYRLLAPSFLKQRSFGALLVPALGLLQLTIVSAYLIYLSAPIVDSLYVSAVVGAITLAVSFVLGPNLREFDFAGAARQFFKSARQDWVAGALRTGLFLVILGLVMAPAIHAGMATTPYRVGIDQVGYGETAQYLLEGGTLRKIRDTLLAQLNTSDLTKAKAQNVRALSFQTYVDSEFLLKASRWGFPGAVAALTFLTRSVHVYRIQFIVDILTYALMLGLAYRILRDYFRLPDAAAIAVVAALGLNCNLLNVYYEGQLTQIFMLPYFMMALMLYLRARSLTDKPNRNVLLSSAFVRSAVMFVLLVACMFSAYNEAVVLLTAFVVVTSLLDLVFYRRVQLTSLAYAGIGLLGGFIAVLPFSNRWLIYTLANLKGLATAGFWQPHWGSFAEILGVLNMYYLPGYILINRSSLDFDLNVGLSVLFVAIYVYFIWATRDLDSSFWVAPGAIVLAAYLKMRFVDHILNYPYMKIYTMLAPLLVCVVFAAVFLILQRRRGAAKGRRVARFAQYVVLLATTATVAVTGTLYIRQYLAQSGYVTADMFSLYKYSNGSRRFNQFALLTPRRAPSIADFMLVPLIATNLVNENDGEKYVAPYLQAPLAVIFRNDDLVCRKCFMRRVAGKVAYMNGSYIVLNMGVKLKDICTKAAKKYTLNGLGIGNKGDWPALPSPQCDYSYGVRYLAAANLKL